MNINIGAFDHVYVHLYPLNSRLALKLELKQTELGTKFTSVANYPSSRANGRFAPGIGRLKTTRVGVAEAKYTIENSLYVPYRPSRPGRKRTVS